MKCCTCGKEIETVKDGWLSPEGYLCLDCANVVTETSSATVSTESLYHSNNTGSNAKIESIPCYQLGVTYKLCPHCFKPIGSNTGVYYCPQCKRVLKKSLMITGKVTDIDQNTKTVTISSEDSPLLGQLIDIVEGKEKK